jgi:hypothetical protein
VKAYVITIQHLGQSRKAAGRCMASGDTVGVHVEPWPAVTPKEDPLATFGAQGWPTDRFTENPYSYPGPCMATFLSHWSLWTHCVGINEPIVILEHDAIFVAPLPDLSVVEWACNLGKPSFGKFKTPRVQGFGPLSSKRFLPGAHGYYVTPKAAAEFLAGTHEARPTDVYLHRDRFPWLQEFYPWPIEARDSFTTIQRELGCKAKHNDVEILEC